MFSVLSSMLMLVLGLVLYSTYIVVWRLYWSPLAQFPGPKLAAATHLYELYYELYKGGKYVFKKAELHEKYGNFQSRIYFLQSRKSAVDLD